MRFALVILFLWPVILFAQVDFGSVKSAGMVWDNDVFFQTDRYYTNGLQVFYKTPKAFNLFNKGKITQDAFFIDHKIFTPAKFNQDNPDFDRPFASSLSISYASTSLDPSKKLRVTHQLQVGLQGRNSGGRTVQNFVHGLLPSSEEIEDWQYQMSTDIIANYSLELEKGFIHDQMFMLNGLAGIEAGAPRLNANIGLHLRFGKLFDRFKFEDFAANDWTIFIYSKPTVSLNAYNTLLQGGLFTHEEPFTLSKINAMTYQIESGLYVAFLDWAIEGSFTYQSPLAQELMLHKWGSIKLSYRLN